MQQRTTEPSNRLHVVLLGVDGGARPGIELEQDIIEIGKRLREQAGQHVPHFSTKRIVEVAYPDAIVTGAMLPVGIHEAVTHTPDGPTIIYSRLISGPQQRFAIIHGLGHLIFNDKIGCRAGHVGDPFVEYRADMLAAETLCPLSWLDRYVKRFPSSDPEERELYLDHVDEIASIFQVPSDVIDLRIRMLIGI